MIISKSMHWLRRRSHLQVFLFLALAAFCSMAQNIVESYPRNLPVKLFQNLSTDLAEEVFQSFFLFIALAAILINGAEPFDEFW